MLELQNTKLMLQELGICKAASGSINQDVEYICEPMTVDMAEESPTAEELLSENFQNRNFKNCHFAENEEEE